MPVPTHGPRCRKLFCRPIRCKDCRQEIFQWACTCGSSVLFDKLGEPWPRHRCARKTLLSLRTGSARPRDSANDLDANPMLFVKCGECAQRLRRRDLEAHMWNSHRSGGAYVSCPRCGSHVSRKNLHKHLAKRCPARRS